MIESFCRVCGYDEGEDRWTGPDGAQYIICVCCGAESGVDDLDLAWVRRYRAKWIADGSPWFAPEERPVDWSLHRQMGQIPTVWR